MVGGASAYYLCFFYGQEHGQKKVVLKTDGQTYGQQNGGAHF